MNIFPASLIQIHYHNRPGGVRHVMEQYSEHFSAEASKAACNLWVCDKSVNSRTSAAEVIGCTLARYHSYRSEAAFNRSADTLTKKILKVLTAPNVQFPAAVIGHNLCLGKNLALSAAFARCAKILGSQSDRYRFFSVLHDFAYDGRGRIQVPECQQPSAALKYEGYLYAAGAPVHFIAIGKGTSAITGLSKKYLSVLPNPVSDVVLSRPPTKKAERSHGVANENEKKRASTPFKNILEQHALQMGSYFDSALPLFCYPSRMINRKNIFEALLVTGILLGGSLVTGTSGTRQSDKRRMRRAHDLSRTHRLSFVSDAGNCIRHYAEGDVCSGNADPFSDTMDLAAAGITTSRSEGFGYSLFTPWLQSNYVVGRMPKGTSLLGGMKIPTLYTRLPLPVSWICLDELYDYYARAYRVMFQKRYWSLQRFSAEVIIKETVDFALLTDDEQVSVIKRCAENPVDREALVTSLKSAGYGWPGLHSLTTVTTEVLDRNKKIVTNWAERGFRNAFVACLNSIPCKPEPQTWYASVRRHFGDPVNFRPYF